MPSHISAGAPWPVRFAFFASAIFLSASGATNLLYGWQRGTDLPSSFVWAGVSVGVSILFALSWPALLKSIDAKRWARAAMISVGLVFVWVLQHLGCVRQRIGWQSECSRDRDFLRKRSSARPS